MARTNSGLAAAIGVLYVLHLTATAASANAASFLASDKERKQTFRAARIE